MKVVSLNTWGGRADTSALLDFVRRHSDADVLCFQEVWCGGDHMVGKIGGGVPMVGVDTRLMEHIQEILPDHVAHFVPLFHDFYGLLTMIKRAYVVECETVWPIYKEQGFVSDTDIGDHGRVLQALHIGGTQPHVVVQLHGLWQRMPAEVLAHTDGKQDNADRILQSERIVAFLRTLTVPYVLVGDFNLLPDSQSIRMLEEAGAYNLIRAYDVKSTRTRFYTKPGRFADYAFVSAGIVVDSFTVLPDEVSDHAPLLVTYTVV